MLKPFVALASCGVLIIVGAVVCCTDSRNPNIKIQFVNSRAGWIVGARLLATTDGGRTWNVIRTEGFGTFDAEYIGYGHRSIQFIDSSTGVQLGGNVLAKTTDGGRTWSQRLTIPKSDGQDIPQSLFFLSPEVGWVVGKYVYQTSDGGRHWVSLAKTPVGDHQRQRSMRIAPSYADYMPAIWFSDPKNGLMVRLDGEVYFTNDGGKTWEMTWRVDKRITDMFFTNDREGWIVGDGGFMARTDDGGKTWITLSAHTKADLTSIFFFNRQLGWATGSNRTIIYTRDAGETWGTALIDGIPESTPLASISFVDSMHGWAVGGNSDPMWPSLVAPSNIVLSTNDGGHTWRSIDP
jgi:photosystem II stability/assembly factor-like uncharacterized protein